MTSRRSLDLKNYSGTANIAYDFGAVTLKSITGYSDFKTTRIQDTDFSGNQIGADYQFTSAKTFSQELQLLSNGDGPFTYVLGAYYFKDKLNGTFINEQFPADRPQRHAQYHAGQGRRLLFRSCAAKPAASPSTDKRAMR